MPKGRKEISPGIRTGRTSAHEAPDLVSPLGTDGAETPDYSPSREVGSKQPKGRAGGSEYQHNERRGG